MKRKMGFLSVAMLLVGFSAQGAETAFLFSTTHSSNMNPSRVDVKLDKDGNLLGFNYYLPNTKNPKAFGLGDLNGAPIVLDETMGYPTALLTGHVDRFQGGSLELIIGKNFFRKTYAVVPLEVQKTNEGQWYISLNDPAGRIPVNKMHFNINKKLGIPVGLGSVLFYWHGPSGLDLKKQVYSDSFEERPLSKVLK